MSKKVDFICSDCGLVTEEQAHWTFHLAHKPGSCAMQRMAREIAADPGIRSDYPELYDLMKWEVEVSG